MDEQEFDAFIAEGNALVEKIKGHGDGALPDELMRDAWDTLRKARQARRENQRRLSACQRLENRLEDVLASPDFAV